MLLFNLFRTFTHNVIYNSSSFSLSYFIFFFFFFLCSKLSAIVPHNMSQLWPWNWFARMPPISSKYWRYLNVLPIYPFFCIQIIKLILMEHWDLWESILISHGPPKSNLLGGGGEEEAISPKPDFLNQSNVCL